MDGVPRWAMSRYNHHSGRRRFFMRLAIACLLIFGLTWVFGRRTSRRRGLHVLLPTTESNGELCKLVLSGAAAGYPDPVLVGWDYKADPGSPEKHLFKIDFVLEYLKSLPDSQSNDLVLVLDAWDIWLQVPPQVLIEQYWKAIGKQDDRLKKQGMLGSRSSHGHRVENTVLLGADKLCWPFNRTQQATHCSDVPESTMSEDTYGPGTDLRRMSLRPRYVNSGTVLGPVSHVRDIFDGISQIISEEQTKSDQFYFQVLFNRQEAARHALASGKPFADAPSYGSLQTEFHIALDQESDVFQVHNWNQPYLTWMSYNHGTQSPPKERQGPLGRLDEMHLPESFDGLPGPFSAGNDQDGLPTHYSWRDVMLGTNTILQNVFPVYHITGVKNLRSLWWPRMWFHPHGKAVLRAFRRKRIADLGTSLKSEAVVATVRGVEYTTVHADKGDMEQAQKARDAANQEGGVWTDRGKYLTWADICAKDEDLLFYKFKT